MRSAFLLLFWIPFSALAQECGPADGGLFSADGEQWEIQADFDRVNDRTLELHEKEKARSAGTIRARGGAFQAEIRARGKFRFEECSVRPFSVKLKDVSPFGEAGKKLRLTTICHRDADWIERGTRDLLKEFTVYRATERLSGPRLAVKLVRLRLLDAEGNLWLEAPAFVRESEKELAARCGMRLREEVVHRWNQEKRTFERFLKQKDGTLRPWDYEYDPAAAARMEFTNRLLNNIDYLVEEDHNVIPLVPLRSANRAIHLVAYDFDLSQAAGGTYYSFQGGAGENAAALREWLAEDAPARDFTRADFLAAWPGILRVLEGSPLDAQGKRELTDWFRVHQQGLSRP